MTTGVKIQCGATTDESLKRYNDPASLKRFLFRQFLESKTDVSLTRLYAEPSSDGDHLDIQINLSVALPPELQDYFTEHEEDLCIQEKVQHIVDQFTGNLISIPE